MFITRTLKLREFHEIITNEIMINELFKIRKSHNARMYS